MLTGVCLSGFSGCVRRCTLHFGGKGRERVAGRCGRLDSGVRHVLGDVGGVRSTSIELRLESRCRGLEHRERGVRDESDVSRACEELQCMECTSSFLVNIVKDGTRYIGVGSSVAGCVRRGLGLRLSRRGALVAGTRGPTGFLNFSISIHGSSTVGQSGGGIPTHCCGNGVILGITVRAIQGGLRRCDTVECGMRGNQRI